MFCMALSFDETASSNRELQPFSLLDLFTINILLTLLGFLPGMIHAIWVVLKKQSWEDVPVEENETAMKDIGETKSCKNKNDPSSASELFRKTSMDDTSLWKLQVSSKKIGPKPFHPGLRIYDPMQKDKTKLT